MLLPRVIYQNAELAGCLDLPPEDNKRLFSSLRLKEGDEIIVCDGRGMEARCVLTDGHRASVLETFASQGEPPFPIHLYPSLSKGERFEWMLQKAAELGASSITPVLSERCVATVLSPEKQTRLRRILRSAAEQSGRGIVPELRETVPFHKAVKSAAGLRIFCYEDETTVTLRSVFRGNAAQISVLTGPEGGYTPEEAEEAGENGWAPVSLGNTILRCETAPLMVLSAVRFMTMGAD